MKPEQRIDGVARQIFSRLLLAMKSKERGIRKNRDAIFLHDYRVALRRTRTLLPQLKGIFPQATIRRFRREFDWLGNVTGAARDLDVYLLSFEKLGSYLPKKKQQDLSSLFDFLHRQRHKEYLRISKALDSRRYRKDMDDWGKIINKPAAKYTKLARNNAPVILVANTSIWRAYNKVLKKGKGIHSSSTDTSLHELRKRCKKLRYLIEFFRDMYPAPKIRLLVDNLKNLQNNLGEYQDLKVQQRFLREFTITLDQSNGAETGVHKSMQILIDKLEQEGIKVREKFDMKFGRFSSAENHKLYNKLFNA